MRDKKEHWVDKADGIYVYGEEALDLLDIECADDTFRLDHLKNDFWAGPDEYNLSIYYYSQTMKRLDVKAIGFTSVRNENMPGYEWENVKYSAERFDTDEEMKVIEFVGREGIKVFLRSYDDVRIKYPAPKDI